MLRFCVPSAHASHCLAVDPQKDPAKGEKSEAEADMDRGLCKFGIASQAVVFRGQIARGHRAVC